LAGDITSAYRQLGAVEWLVRRAEEDPKTFVSMLMKLLPRDASEAATEGGKDGDAELEYEEFVRRALALCAAGDEGEPASSPSPVGDVGGLPTADESDAGGGA
jgi:hypothetical protein